MNLRDILLDQLDEAPWNAHVCPPAILDRLKNSIARWGVVENLVVRPQNGRFEVVSGNHRLRLYRDQSLPAAPCLVLDLDDGNARLMAQTLNNTRGADDPEKAEALYASLPSLGVTLEDLASLVELPDANEPTPGLTDPDDIPELPVEPVSKPGDLWLLGEHRLLCGDSTKAEDVKRVMRACVPHLCVTDPPYGVGYDPAWRNVKAAKGHLAWAAHRVGPVTNDDRSDWRETWALFPGDVIYSWHPAGATSLVHAQALIVSGFAIRMQIIWAKRHFPIGRGDYHVRHEPCWYAVRKGKPSRRTDDRTQTTLWEINLDKNVEGGHSTQKPVECMARPMRNHDAPEVYDPFLGSGTTLIATERLGRRCYAIEIEPRYVDVAVKRWEAFTGKNAQLEAP